MHRVIRTIGGRQYEYEEESYRIPGEKNPRKRSRYIGPVEPLRKKKRGLVGVIHELVRNKQPWELSENEDDARERMKRFDAERARIVRNNELLSAPTITLDAIREIAASQGDSAAAPSSVETGPHTDVPVDAKE